MPRTAQAGHPEAATYRPAARPVTPDPAAVLLDLLPEFAAPTASPVEQGSTSSAEPTVSDMLARLAAPSPMPVLAPQPPARPTTRAAEVEAALRRLGEDPPPPRIT